MPALPTVIVYNYMIVLYNIRYMMTMLVKMQTMINIINKDFLNLDWGSQ